MKRVSSSAFPPPLPKRWVSSWVWVSPHPERNAYYHARRRFRLPWKPRRAVVWATADSRYRLWVNGRPVSRGPARCFPERQAVDAVDVTARLRRGWNVLALLVHQYGESTFAYVHRGGSGFLLQAEIEGPRGERIVIDDTGWRVRRSEAHNPLSARTSVQTGFQELYDARRAPGDDWTAIGFDDGDWRRTDGFGPVGSEPWIGLEARGIPFLEERPKRARRILTLFQGETGPEAGDPSRIMENFTAEQRRPSRGAGIRDPEALLRGSEGARIARMSPAEFRGIVVDFGEEVAGYPRLEILGACGGEVIDLVYTERVDGNGLPLYPEPHPGWSLRLADRYVCRSGDQSWEGFSMRGFRYLTLVIRNARAPFRIRNVHLNATGYPVEPVGRFRSSDRMLNRIWDVASRTLRLCMFDAYVDCPWREQAQWLGDAVVEGLTNFHVFGDPHLMRRTLRQAALARTHDGLLYGVYPSEAHGCVLPDYSLTWILALDGYYTYTGDISLLIDTYDAAAGVMERFAEHAEQGGLLRAFPGRWLFLDWADLDRGGYSATFSLFYLLALKTMIRICNVLGRPSRPYVERFAQVRPALRRHFENPETKIWHEAIDPETMKPAAQVSQHANALALLDGHAEDRAVVPVILEADRSPETTIVRASTYFYFFVHAALLHAGELNAVLDSIRRRWGAMIEAGATTFWEGFTLDSPGTSSCHAWSCGPAFHLSRTVLGARPAHPGWTRFLFRPDAGDLEWAKGRVPTPRGPIEIEWERTRDGGTIEAAIVVPSGLRAYVGEGSNRSGKLLRAGKHRVRFNVRDLPPTHSHLGA